MRRAAPIIGLALASFAGPVAGAQESQPWSIVPASDGAGPGARTQLVYDVVAGRSLQDAVAIENRTDGELRLRLFAADAYNTTEGAFTLRGQDDERVDAGAWVQLPTERLVVPARTRAEVPFLLIVPDDASPGDHAGGIVALNEDPESRLEQGALGIDVKRALGVRLFARVDGPLDPSVTIRNIDVSLDRGAFAPLSGRGRATVGYEIANTGNARLTATVQAEVRGWFGRTLTTFEARTIAELLPGSAVRLTESVDRLPILGPVTARISVSSPEASAIREGGSWVVPWVLVAIVLLVAAGLVWWWRRPRGTAPGAPVAVREPAGRR